MTTDRVQDGRQLMNPLAIYERGILRPIGCFVDRRMLLHDYTPADEDGTVAIAWNRDGVPIGWSTPCTFAFWRNRNT